MARRSFSASFEPSTKNVALMPAASRMSSTRGVTAGSGPLSKLSVTSTGWQANPARVRLPPFASLHVPAAVAGSLAVLHVAVPPAGVIRRLVGLDAEGGATLRVLIGH